MSAAVDEPKPWYLECKRRWRERASVPAERLANPDAILTRTDLRDLGWERRAVDAIVRGCPAVAIPGYSRTVVLVRDDAEHTFRGDRVRPCG